MYLFSLNILRDDFQRVFWSLSKNIVLNSSKLCNQIYRKHDFFPNLKQQIINIAESKQVEKHFERSEMIKHEEEPCQNDTLTVNLRSFQNAVPGTRCAAQ